MTAPSMWNYLILSCENPFTATSHKEISRYKYSTVPNSISLCNKFDDVSASWMSSTDLSPFLGAEFENDHENPCLVSVFEVWNMPILGMFCVFLFIKLSIYPQYLFEHINL